jgi:5-methylcytosine-specific restriction endonuclease McrA
MYWDDEPSRRNFTITTKKIEWISAAGKDVMQYIRDKKFVRTSRCRKCKRQLVWGDGSYNFDHKDNNPANNSQKNCYLVCRNCHGKATKIGKRAIRCQLPLSMTHVSPQTLTHPVK